MADYRVLLYIYTDMKNDRPFTEEHRLFRLVQQSLSWDYFGGSHFQRVCHGESGIRLAPFLVIVCPLKNKYFSNVLGSGLFEVSPGEALLVPSGARHTVAMPDAGILHHAHIQYTVFGSIDLLQFFDVPWVVNGRDGRKIAAITRDLNKEMGAISDGYDALSQIVRINRLTGELLDVILAVSKLRSIKRSQLTDLHKFEPVLHYIEDNIASPITRAELAQLMSLSETRFHYVFKAAMNQSPMAYLMGVRMKKAQVLLAQSHRRISEVGEHIGYPDVFHFSKSFKTFVGVSPLAYRKNFHEHMASLA